MKRTVCLISLIIMCSFLIGCEMSSESEITNTIEDANSRFYKTGKGYNIDNMGYYEIVDRETGNIYLHRNNINSNDMCPLYNKDGKIQNINDKSED